MGVDALARRRGWVVTPQLVDQPVDRDGPVRLEKQRREQYLQLLAGDRTFLASDQHLERPQDPKLGTTQAPIGRQFGDLSSVSGHIGSAFAAFASLSRHVVHRKEHHMRRPTGLLVIAIVTSLVAAAASAHAAGPVRERVPIDETFTFSGCGFVVEEHDVFTLQFTSWYDANGNRLRQIVTAPGARITYTNPTTGASVTAVNPFVVHKSDNADGSTTIAFTGLVFAIHGGGSAYVDSGRDLIVFSDAGVKPLSSSGPSADLCEALAATIG